MFQGSTSLFPPPPTAHRYSHHTKDEVYDQGDVSDGQEEHRDSMIQMPYSVAGRREGMSRPVIPLQRAGRYIVRDRTTFTPPLSTHIPSTIACPTNSQRWGTWSSVICRTAIVVVPPKCAVFFIDPKSRLRLSTVTQRITLPQLSNLSFR